MHDFSLREFPYANEGDSEGALLQKQRIVGLAIRLPCRVESQIMLRPPDFLETARLIARRPCPADAEAVFSAYASDPAATKFLSWTPYRDLAALREFLGQRAAAWESEGGHYAYLLCEKGSNQPIGSIGCIIDQWKVTVGYVLGRAYWGRGYTTEALIALQTWALAQPSIFRVWAFCDVENPASARVMEKAGMVREGILKRWHVCPTIGPEARDCLVYAKVK